MKLSVGFTYVKVDEVERRFYLRDVLSASRMYSGVCKTRFCVV